jgi:hypothetical protein
MYLSMQPCSQTLCSPAPACSTSSSSASPGPRWCLSGPGGRRSSRSPPLTRMRPGRPPSIAPAYTSPLQILTPTTTLFTSRGSSHRDKRPPLRPRPTTRDPYFSSITQNPSCNFRCNSDHRLCNILHACLQPGGAFLLSTSDRPLHTDRKFRAFFCIQPRIDSRDQRTRSK